MSTRISLTAVLLFIIGTSIAVGQNSATEKEVINTLDGFHQAIIDNNSQAAQNLLSESVRILEGENIETKEEYLSHHFHSDGKFLSAMKRKVESRNVTIEGNTAWVSTHSRIWGTYSDKKLDLSSLELAVLKKEEGNWNITALHWSSSNN
ncbi:nuclear transport factor 2 family protein [Fodinibius salsisoli]|uniref:Nuclear transport factor 2 family protein n=1 Tax=Fodinibius salsisoli TaxID=2820877 RepID=A0ABT3PKM4_9BACT|nr:nuclear transport factor 2 family protein [Fodinibius salsisoli]MCW9705759.1 nuclear transport factor 2 family protein [Fodinibius salsisoli]